MVQSLVNYLAALYINIHIHVYTHIHFLFLDSRSIGYIRKLIKNKNEKQIYMLRPIFPVWISTISTKSGNPPGNRGKSQGAHSMAWCLFTDFVLNCDCSLPDKFFVTGRFQVWFVQNKSEIALQCNLALSQFQMLIKTDVNYMQFVIWYSTAKIYPNIAYGMGKQALPCLTIKLCVVLL